MRSLGRPALAAALTLVLGLGVAALPAHADEAPVPSSSTPDAGVTAAEDTEPSDPEPTTPEPSSPEPSTPEPSASVPTPDVPEETEPTPDPSPTPDVPDDPADKPLVLDDAQLRWGLSSQLHRKPFYGQNFLTAGVLADTGGRDMPPGRWKQSEGAVSIVRADGAKYVPATWTTFGTGADHQVVINQGKGTSDLAAGTATIAWSGRFGVARYSGQTGFTVSNPRLTIEDGQGKLTGTLDGFGVSRDGNGSGNASGPLPTAKDVVLAEFDDVKLTKKGLTVTPTFWGVRGVHPDQKPNGERWGSFPAPFIDFVDQVGQSPFWMTSGAGDDALKAGSPVTISFNAKDAVAVKPPKADTDDSADPIKNQTNTAPKPPRQPQTMLPVQTPFVPVSTPPLTTADVQPVSFVQPSMSSLAGLPPVLVNADGSSSLGWWLAVTFLLMAALAIALPGLVARSRVP